MGKKQLVFVGTYTEPILFGTGKVLQQGREFILRPGWDTGR